MKKIVFIFFIFSWLSSMGELPQRISILYMPTKTTLFGGTGYPINTRIEAGDTTISIRLTHEVTASQSLLTVYANHWYAVIGFSLLPSDSLHFLNGLFHFVNPNYQNLTWKPLFLSNHAYTAT